MNGFHDLGGFQGFGQVPHRIDSLSYKPVFKDDWEHLAYSLMFVACDHLGLFSIDEVRHAVERLDVRQHVGTTYYERYVIATASLLVEAGAISREALNQALGAPFKLANPPHSKGRAAIADRVPFEVGERVRVRDEHVAGHVRFPGYVRGKVTGPASAGRSRTASAMATVRRCCSRPTMCSSRCATCGATPPTTGRWWSTCSRATWTGCRSRERGGEPAHASAGDGAVGVSRRRQDHRAQPHPAQPRRPARGGDRQRHERGEHR